MRKNHEPAGRRFWESYVELSSRKNEENILEVNVGADDPILLTLPEAIEYASKIAKRENFGDLVELEDDIRLFGQNHLTERKFYFKQIGSSRIEKPVSIIFKERPQKWGLRGDPHLWDELERVFAAVSLPCSEESFIHHFESFF